MPNDLAMFRVTGQELLRSAAAMKAVMRVPLEVLPSVDDDGFARKIAEFAAVDWTIEDADPAVIAAG